MTDIEEEQPTQQRGRRDWSAEGDEETELEGHDELGGRGKLVNERNATGTRAFDGKRIQGGQRPEVDDEDAIGPSGTVGEEHRGRGDANPGGTLSRDPDLRREQPEPEPEPKQPTTPRRMKR